MTSPFTSDYIRMNKAAEEIQSMRLDDEHYNLGDWFVGDHGSELFDRSTGYLGIDPVWIPRLDQLLGILGESPVEFNLTEHINRTFPDPGYLFKFGKDWHELILAVIMREKYGKTWNGSEWNGESNGKSIKK